MIIEIGERYKRIGIQKKLKRAGKDQFPDSWKGKGAGLLGFRDCQCCHFINDC
jgi:hypothetical protein